MRHIRRHLKQAGLLLATFLTAASLLAPSAMAAAPGDVGTWTTSPHPLPEILYGASSVTYNGYVYVMDGASSMGDMNPNVYYAKLNGDGSLGSWVTSPNAIPYPLFGASSVAYNGYVYLFGGDFSGANFDKVFYAKLNNDGSVGVWNAGNALPKAAYASTAITYNGYVYVMGGASTMGSMNQDIFYAKLNGDGSVGAWNTSADALPKALAYATSVIQGDNVYLIGGSDSSYVSQSAVYYAKLNNDGTVGSWTTNTNGLPQASSGATSVIANGYVYVMGGGDTDTVSTVYYAKLNGDGSVDTWNTSDNELPQVRSGATSVTYNGYVYVMGGADDDFVIQSTVYYARLGPDPSPTVSTPPTAPNTGYGTPPTSYHAAQALGVSAIVAIGSGLSLLYRQRSASRN